MVLQDEPALRQQIASSLHLDFERWVRVVPLARCRDDPAHGFLGTASAAVVRPECYASLESLSQTLGIVSVKMSVALDVQGCEVIQGPMHCCPGIVRSIGETGIAGYGGVSLVQSGVLVFVGGGSG